MDIPIEIVIDHIIPYYESKSVVNLQATCKTYNEIEVFPYLLKRDYKPDCNVHEGFLRPNSLNMYKFLVTEGKPFVVEEGNKRLKRIMICFLESNDQISKEAVHKRYPGHEYFLYLSFPFDRFPLANALLYSWCKFGKLDNVCKESPDCRCFYHTFDLLKGVTGEQE